MALPAVVDSLDKVPEPVRKDYEASEGKFVLKVEGTPVGFVPAAELAQANGKVVEFRDTNTALLKEVGELRPLKEQFKDIDPAAARAAIAAQAEFQKKGAKTPDDLGKLISDAVAVAVKPLQETVTQLTTKEQEANKRADEMTLRTTINEKFTKVGGKPTAIDFIVMKANDAFAVEGGQVKAKPNKFSPTRPSEPLSVDEWLTQMTKEADFAFGPSQGGGAPPNPGAGGGGHKPGQIVITNPTPAQLGEFGAAVKKGTHRFEYTT